MSTACCPAVPLSDAPASLHPHAPVRWPESLKQSWKAWRERAQRRAELRALDALSDSTRRDIGLAEREWPKRDRALWDHERGLW